MKINWIEWIQAIDKEEYIGFVDGEKYFIIRMIGYLCQCKSVSATPLGWKIVCWDKNLNKLKKRAQDEFECRGANEVVIDIGNSFETKRRLNWQIFHN